MENLFRDDAKKAKKRKKSAKATLSFAMDDGDDGADLDDDNSRQNDEDEPPTKRNKLKKNPNVDTSFLPDREREEAERKERERLRLEWLAKQEQMKKEDIEVVYSYWDGSGHRKSVTVRFYHSLLAGRRSLKMSSARKETILVVSLKNVVNSFLNYEALAWTI